MGGNISVSTNIANNVVNNMVNIMNDYAQTCSQSGTDLAGIFASCGCTLNFIGGVTVQNSAYFSTKCTQNVQAKTQLASNMQAQAIQDAQVLGSTLGFGDISVASNIVSQAINESTNIVQDFFDNCVNQFSNVAQISCTDPGTTINVTGDTTVQNVIGSMIECGQNVTSATRLKQAIKSAINQSAVVQGTDLMTLIIAVFVIIIGVMSYGGVSTFGQDALYVIVPIVLIILVIGVYYAATASANGWFPYLVPS